MSLKSSGLKLVTLSLALVVALVLSELMVRAFAPPWLLQRMEVLQSEHQRGSGAVSAPFGTDEHIPLERRGGVFFSFTPNSQFELSHSEYHVVVHTDEYGGRRTFSPPDGQPAIIAALGDSFTFGLGVEDDATYVNHIATSLPSVRLVNLGVSGSALPQQLELIRLRDSEISPAAYLIFFFLGNDFSDIDAAYERRNAPATLNRGAQSPSPLARVNALVHSNRLLRQSYLIQLLRKFVLDTIGPRNAGVATDPFFHLMDASQHDHQRRASEQLAYYLDQLKRLQSSTGTRLLIIAVPDVNQLSAERRAQRARLYGIPHERLEPFRPNAILRRAVEASGLPYLDPTQCLTQNASDPESLYFAQDSHFRAAGHRVFADCIIPDVSRFVSSARS